MRLWSIHPQYLDSKGLVALWREALLAQHVLLEKTKGYRFHPQLERFKGQSKPAETLGFYLLEVYDESIRRGYAFDKNRILTLPKGFCPKIPITSGQIQFEITHLAGKLEKREPGMLKKINSGKRVRLHPLFHAVPGGIANWERA